MNAQQSCVERPWGRFIILSTVHDDNEVVHRQKLLLINPAVQLQLHKHTDYAELWIGENRFDYTLENDNGELITKTAQPFDRVFIPKNRKHAIINTHNRELRVFELQMGVIKDHDNMKYD